MISRLTERIALYPDSRETRRRVQYRQLEERPSQFDKQQDSGVWLGKTTSAWLSASETAKDGGMGSGAEAARRRSTEGEGGNRGCTAAKGGPAAEKRRM